MQRKLDDVVGRVLLRLAAVLHRTVAGEEANGRWLSRRDRAIREAYRRGVSVERLAAGLRLTPSWIRQRLKGKPPAKPPVIEEAA